MLGVLQVSEQEFGIRFEKYVRLYPDFCNSVLTTGYISELIHNDKINVLIGPGCSGDIMICGKLATYFQ